MMLAVVASNSLSVADAATLKHSHSTLPLSITNTEEFLASAWTIDNSALYLASSQNISQYDPSSHQLKVLHTANDGNNIRCMVVKDKSSVIYSSGSSIHILECGGQTSKVVQSLGPHKQEVLSLSRSNDSTLLACGLSNAAYVHNFTTDAQTTLRGLPSKSSTAICMFHAHIRTRLLIGHGDQLLVYDTTRPSAPLKTIPMSNTGTTISAIACSPFSKTLVAVAMSKGFVGLVDLDKEKALFRVLSLNVSLTSIAFSPEGASIYLGTEDGKLLVQDLRTLDKSPKRLIISESGKPITTLAVQKKLKSPPEDVKTRGTPKTLATSPPISRTASSPRRARATRAGALTASTPTRSASSKTTTPRPIPLSKDVNSRQVLSPSSDPHGNSPRLGSKEVLKSTTIKIKQPQPLSNTSLSSTPKHSSAKVSLPSRMARRTSAPMSGQTRKPSTTAYPVEASVTTTPSEPPSSTSNITTRNVRSRKTLSSSLAPSASEPSALPSTRVTSSAFASTVISRPEPIPSTHAHALPVPSTSADVNPNLPLVPNPDHTSRTPSPELPTMKTDIMTPVPAQKKKKALAVLGLGTPEVTAWIKAGKGHNLQQNGVAGPTGKSRIKSVGFRDGAYDSEVVQAMAKERGDRDEDQECERERSISLQISPRRPLPASSSSHSQGHAPSHSWDASPTRPRHATHMPGTPSAGSAHELLRTIVRDVMYDFQRETRAEMMGLHLDLVKMGRGWKQELRTLMDEYVGDLNDLREENRRLRAENDRLRGGC